KVALITGGARGIGESIARLFTKHGAKVVTADILDDLGQTVVENIGLEKASYIHCDVCIESDIEKAINYTIDKHGKLDIMVNNAAIAGCCTDNLIIAKSHGSDQGRRPMPIDQEEVTSRFLQRVSPQRRSPWNNKKKNLSPECKEMLMHRIKEIEAFNASKESKEHGEDSRTQKERRARKDTQDYVNDEYISWNGSLYALKVNSLSRFLSFMDLVRKDSLVYKNWEIFSRKFVEMIKWFYLVHLNYERLEAIPPRVGVMEINLLSLHKIIDDFGGYLCVTMGDMWKTVAELQGLTKEDGEAMRDCYKRFIDLVQVYYDTAERPWNDTRMPGKEVGEGSRIGAREDPQGMDKGKAGIGETQGALGEGINQETRFGVKLESNIDKDNAEIGSMTGSNDFEVIV
ncbi:ARID DNA-binding domain-containing protein, partial [Tanacetum coccineum]